MVSISDYEARMAAGATCPSIKSAVYFWMIHPLYA